MKMVSDLSHSCLQKEIWFLREDLKKLNFELNALHRTFRDPYLADMFERRKAVFHWKKTRLEALELFARAQLAINEIKCPKLPGYIIAKNVNQRTKKLSRNNIQVPRNQVRMIKNEKIEDGINTISQSVADTLKNMKKEKIDYDENSVSNNKFIPKLIPADKIKTEVE